MNYLCQMPLYTDQLNRTVNIPFPPKRIISLVPSQTELLSCLSLEKDVVGITKFCVHPEEWFRTKTRIGGTKNVDLEKITSLQPDLIIANKEENVKDDVEALAASFPVWVSDVNDLQDALSMIVSLGKVTGREDTAQQLATNIKTAFAQLKTPSKNPRTAYLIWKDPYMTVGGDTFIHSLLEAAGFGNVFEEKTRYPIITIKELQATNCELLLLSSEPYPFKEKHIAELREQLPAAKILLVDGEMFSWYGSRLLHAPAYFAALQKQIALMA